MISPNKVEVATLGVADAPEMARFFSEQLSERHKYQIFLDRLHWYARNPANKPDVSLGWGVRAQDGALVGAMLCIPLDFLIAGTRTTFLMSSSFYVDEAHRGCGLPIFFAYRALERKYVLYASTANEASGRLWQTCKASPIAGSDYEFFGPIRWAPLVEEAAFRKLGKFAGTVASHLGFIANLRPGLREHAEPEALLEVTDPEQAVMPGFSDNTVDLARDAAFIKWRYFDQPHTKFDLYRVVVPGTEKNACVAVNIGVRGYRNQIRVLNIADLWVRLDAAGFQRLIATLAAKYQSDADAIVLRGFEQFEESAARLGFLRRVFGSPIGWCIDRLGVLQNTEFRLVPAATDQL